MCVWASGNGQYFGLGTRESGYPEFSTYLTVGLTVGNLVVGCRGDGSANRTAGGIASAPDRPTADGQDVAGPSSRGVPGAVSPSRQFSSNTGRSLSMPGSVTGSSTGPASSGTMDPSATAWASTEPSGSKNLSHGVAGGPRDSAQPRGSPCVSPMRLTVSIFTQVAAGQENNSMSPQTSSVVSERTHQSGRLADASPGYSCGWDKM